MQSCKKLKLIIKLNYKTVIFLAKKTSLANLIVYVKIKVFIKLKNWQIVLIFGLFRIKKLGAHTQPNNWCFHIFVNTLQTYHIIVIFRHFPKNTIVNCNSY